MFTDHSRYQPPVTLSLSLSLPHLSVLMCEAGRGIEQMIASTPVHIHKGAGRQRGSFTYCQPESSYQLTVLCLQLCFIWRNKLVFHVFTSALIQCSLIHSTFDYMCHRMLQCSFLCCRMVTDCISWMQHKNLCLAFSCKRFCKTHVKSCKIM